MSVLVVLSLLIQPFTNGPLTSPLSPLQNATVASADGDTGSPLPPDPQQLSVSDVTDSHLPSLVVGMDIYPKQVNVGGVFTATVTVTNQAPDAATNLTVTLPLPAGAASYPDPNSNPSGWTWTQSSLPADSSVSFTSTLQLNQAPTGDAILALPQATAGGLTAAVQHVGGALVTASGSSSATSSFSPGTSTTLQSSDGRTQVQIPSDAASSSLALTYTVQPPAGSVVPGDVAGYKRGFGTFYLNASDTQGNAVHQFSKPLTIQITYTPEQLRALGISEDDLTLFWFDESQPDGGAWVPLDSSVDTSAHTATTLVNHFSAFQLGDGSSPSAAFIPSLQGWQVGLFTGSASYSYPIEVPAGPGGIKPTIQLNYDSSSTDGATGLRRNQQASWVGKGWSLDTGSIALNRLTGDRATSRYFSLVLNGQSFDLVRGNPIVQGTPSLSRPSDWDWRATNESFIKVRAVPVGPSTGDPWASPTPVAGRGGFNSCTGSPATRYEWQVWTKDGTRYDFEEDAWQGFQSCAVDNTAFMEGYKWFLSQVTDTHQNTITYNYARNTPQVRTAPCHWTGGTIDYSVWPTSITWGGNSGTTPPTPDRYKAEFVSAARTIDTDYERADNQIGSAPRETQQLLAIRVRANTSQPYNPDPRPAVQGGPWELIRQYKLCYAGSTDQSCPQGQANILSDYSIDNNNNTFSPDPATAKLTLTGIYQTANNGTTTLPATTFTYGMTRGSGYYPNADWNRLVTANNGQGGTITFGYQNVGAAINDHAFKNFRRVTTKTVNDGQAHSYTWTYTYSNPALNSLGTSLGYQGPNQLPNSAQVYYATMLSTDPNQRTQNLQRLVHRKQTEFRGHSYVVERDPNGNETEHWFYQGDVGCTPTAQNNSSQILNDACFVQLRDRELLKGREWKTITHQGSVSGNGPKLSETQHTFTVGTVTYTGYTGAGGSDDTLVGLWRAFTYESQTQEKAWDGSATALTKTTTYVYDQNNYGNLTSVQEADDSGVLRTTSYQYAYPSDLNTNYIVDRKSSENIKDAAGNWLARTLYGYDGYNPGVAFGTKGELWAVRKVYNIPITVGQRQVTMPSTAYSNDTTYSYDDYGNQVTVSTYAGRGSATNTNAANLSSWSWSAPGGADGTPSPRTTTTIYEPGSTTPPRPSTEPTFHSFPLESNPPAVNGVVLRESATYDYRMGLITSVTDPNNTPTYQEYDAFGRWTKLIKYGDSSGLPTASVAYYDNEVPVRYGLTPI